MPLLVSRDFHLGAKDRLYSACARSVMLYGSETWPVKDEGVNRQERHDAEMVRWMYVTAEDKISTEDLKTRLKLKSRGECLQDTRLQWFCYLERMIGLGLVNVEPSRLAVVSPDHKQEKRGER